MKIHAMKLCPYVSAILLLAAAPLCVSAAEIVYSSNIQTLNAAFDDGGALPSGTATLTLNTDNVIFDGPNLSGTATLQVQISATGLEDVSTIDGATHVAHIHGQFLSNVGKPAGQQTNGSFFTGEGGVPFGSQIPSTAEDDGDSDGFLNFFEGLPDYGPVVLNLSALQVPSAPSGTPPLIQGLNVVAADNGIGLFDAFPNRGETFTLDATYSFDLSNQDARRQFNNLMPLTSREIVLHGLTVPKDISDEIDAAAMQLGLPEALLGKPAPNNEEFRTTAPVAAGAITLVSFRPTPQIPEPSTAALAGLAVIGAASMRKRLRG